MEREQPFIQLTLEIDQPVELGDFIGAFTAVANEYDRFVRQTHPEFAPNATLFVREVRTGSYIAELIPWAYLGWTYATQSMGQVMVVDQFVRKYGARLTSYFQPGGRAEDASKSELKDFFDQVTAIANNPNSKAEIAAIEIKDGKRRVRAAIKFDTSQARTAQQQIEAHRREIERTSDVDHSRVLMVFTQTNVKTPGVGKRSGELVKIESISNRSLALIYASELAEARIKHEITEAEENVYKKGFVVDVNVELRNGKPVAYRVTHVHQVIDLPDDEE